MGAALGAVLGHQFDETEIDFRFDALGFKPEELENVQAVFVTVLFQVMGYIAKSDGRVSESEILGARKAMDRLDLKQSSRLLAMRLFNEGKQESFEIEAALRHFSRGCGSHSDLVRFLIKLEIEAALVEGRIHPEKERILFQLCDALAFSRYEFFGMRTRLQAERRLGDLRQGSPRMGHYNSFFEFQERAYREEGGSYTALHSCQGLQEAYAMLGLAITATPAEIKRAYRRAISRHHPDKLAAAGVPPHELHKATQMTQEIQKAYEAICRARSI